MGTELPPGLLDYFCKSWGLDRDSKLERLVNLALNRVHVPSVHKHRWYPDCFYQRRQEMRSWFGLDYHRYLKETGMIDVVGDYSRSEGMTYPYRVTNDFRAALINFAQNDLSEVDLAQWGELAPVVRVPKAAIASRDARMGDYKRATKCQIPAFVDLSHIEYTDFAATYPRWLEQSVQHGKNNDSASSPVDATALVAAALMLKNRLVINRQTGQLGVIERYTEANAGRLFAGSGSLQTIPSHFRRVLFTGHTEWDFEACHPAILLGLGRKEGYILLLNFTWWITLCLTGAPVMCLSLAILLATTQN